MSEPIRVPDLGESVSEAEVSAWLKQEGDRVATGDAVVTLGTDKADLEVGAEASGVLEKIERGEGDTVRVGDVLGTIAPSGDAESAEDGSGDDGAQDAKAPEESRSGGGEPAEEDTEGAEAREAEAPRDSEEEEPPPDTGEEEKAPSAETAPPDETSEAERDTEERNAEERDAGETEDTGEEDAGSGGDGPRPTPVAARVAAERRVSLDEVEGTGRGGRITKRDVLARADRDADASGAGDGDADASEAGDESRDEKSADQGGDERRPEERQRLSRRRRTIARRLVEAQQTAAALSTFNDVDMSALGALRARHGERFAERHGTRLGITSFFVRASVAALRLHPRLNAEIQGEEMVLKRYYDVGIAVSAPAGLVVPVLRDADRLSLAEIEKGIDDLAGRAREDRLGVDDLRGGTFSITNGGIFGSLLSTPILNPPQVGILGLHRIEERPVAVEGRVEVRPVMYVALTYDHRIVDGREAVTFLGEIKRLIESPEELLLDA